jgi:hypothetical protein
MGAEADECWEMVLLWHHILGVGIQEMRYESDDADRSAGRI